jgi:hypothetical protein
VSKKRESRRERRQRESREAQAREQADIEATKTNLGRIGARVDPDILAYVIGQAGAMGQSSQQAATYAAQVQQIRDSGKRVILDDDGLGYHTA